jgi:predicted ATP-grasp superfamily ATP-dependent carboligase
MNPTERCLLVLTSKLGYQARSFADAAKRLGAHVVFATDRCEKLDDPWGDAAIPVHFEDAEAAAQNVVAGVSRGPSGISGVLALGDRPLATAARVARALQIPYNSPESVENCRTKLRQREVLRAAGLPVPEFFAFGVREDLARILPRVKFPCVVKPTVLAASQGVIRANNAGELAAAVARIRALVESPEVAVTREPGLAQLLVERYIEGEEVAVEALLANSELRVLAIFDKPDHSQGPYFEETLYITPATHPALALLSVEACLKRSAQALGLTHGPLHCEFRINEDGPWVLEIQPRPIGGLCARALRFIETGGREERHTAETQREKRDAEKKEGAISLEALLVRHALGMSAAAFRRERNASGVMMIPVPQSGVLERVAGEEEARAVPGVTELHITARLHDYIAAWPEGSSYLGFLFARGDSPEFVAAALRTAHSKLRFTITPRLPVEHPLSNRVAES